ncbi:MAG: cytochrome C oxidase subunit IV family protein [Gemmatimonadales bacterium]
METAERKHPNYIRVWWYLLILTVVEVGVAFVSHMPKTVLILVLMFLAVWKALLVALFFMHLKFESKALRVIVASPLLLAVILIIVVISEKLL